MHNNKPREQERAGPTLAQCRTGEGGRIASIADGPDAGRLKALGLCPGHLVRVARAGDPLVVDVLNMRLALSRSLARHICMIPCPGPHHA